MAAALSLVLGSLALAAVTAVPLPAGSNSEDPWTCDPLNPTYCPYPFPNDFYLSEPDSKGIRHVNITIDAMPRDVDGSGFDVNNADFQYVDGFSPIPTIQVYFPDLSTGNLANWTHIEASLRVDSPTVLLNTKTGQRVAHWTEIDISKESKPGQEPSALLMYPAERLNDTTRYVVGMRSLVDNKGKAIDASVAFQALRDNLPSGDATVNARRARFEAQVFAPLEAAGVSRASLQIAWDFTTSSTRSTSAPLMHIRDDAMKRISEAGGISYTILQNKENPRDLVAREIQGLMKVPWYLNQAEPGTDVRIVRDPEDPYKPVFNGEHWIDFKVVLPESVFKQRTRGPILQYGHGLFGSASEVNTGYLDQEANEFGYIRVAVDWVGMCYEDEAFVALMMASDVSDFPMVPDRSLQGFLNALLAMELVSSDKFVNDPAVLNQGQPTIDPSQRFYYGNSLGGIFGTVYMAMTQSVQRGVIGVGGAPFSILLPRSKDFTALFDVILARYPKHLDRLFLLSTLQLVWDKAEPAGFLHHISRDPLPNTPVHTIVAHYGLGDAQVSMLGTLTLARSVNAHVYTSNVREQGQSLWGLTPLADNATLTGPGNNLVQGWDFGAPLIPFGNVPPNSSTDTHEKPRRNLQSQAQIHEFLINGTIRNHCGGPCVQK